MRRLILAAALASLLAGEAFANEFERLPLREAAKIIDLLAPLNLEADRTLCATGGHERTGRDDMPIHVYCRKILDETAKRHIKSQDEALIMESYRRWSWDHPHEIVRGVGSAALKDEAQFISVRDADQQRIWMPLPCGLAYDVGFFYGIKHSNSGLGFGEAFEATNAEREACFTDDIASRKAGFMAGVHDGRSAINTLLAPPAAPIAPRTEP